LNDFWHKTRLYLLPFKQGVGFCGKKQNL